MKKNDSNWQAHLALKFADDGGTTRLVERSHSGPLRVQKPLYPEGARICHAIVLHPPGGVVGGDQLSVHAGVGSGAHALLTTPGAAKWYRANGHVSRQQINLTLEPGARLEWLPQESIFFDAADVQLSQNIALGTDACYIGCEILCFGRTASGESFDTGRIAQRTSITREGRLIWWEQGSLTGGSAAMHSAPGLYGNTVCATLLAAGRPLPAAVLQAIRQDVSRLTGNETDFGISQLKAVLVARYLGRSSETARRVMLCVWQHARPALLDCAAVVPRSWNT